MRELVERILRHIVDSPNELEVREVRGGGTVILEISAAREDLGKIIGKNGKIANALRVLMGAVANRQNKRVIVEILET